MVVVVIIFCYYYYNKNLKKDVLVYKTIAEEYGDGVQVAGRGDVFKKFSPKRLKDLPSEQQKRMNTLIDEEIKEREIMRKKNGEDGPLNPKDPHDNQIIELKRIIDNSTMEVIVKEVTELIQDPGAKQSLKEFKNKYGKDKIRKNVWKQAPRRKKKNLRKKQLSCDRTIKCSIVVL